MRTAGCAGGRVQGTVPLTRTRGPPRPFPKDTCSSLINPNGPAHLTARWVWDRGQGHTRHSQVS